MASHRRQDVNTGNTVVRTPAHSVGKNAPTLAEKTANSQTGTRPQVIQTQQTQVRVDVGKKKKKNSARIGHLQTFTQSCVAADREGPLSSWQRRVNVTLVFTQQCPGGVCRHTWANNNLAPFSSF